MQLSGNLKSQKWALKRNIFMTYKWNQNNNLCHTAKECVISNNTPLVKISSDLSPFCFRGNFLSKIENKQLNNISCITTEDHSTKTTGRRLDLYVFAAFRKESYCYVQLDFTVFDETTTIALGNSSGKCLLSC